MRGGMADRVTMTVLEAAQALGVSDDTIRRGLEGKGPLRDLLRDASHKDNTGRWVIELAPEAIERNRSLGRRHHQPTPPEAPLTPPADPEMAALRELAAGLRAAADTAAEAHRAELERLAAAHAAELERIQTTHAADATRLREELERNRARLAQTEREREEARVGRAAAEGEMKGLRLALEPRRYFWRRWTG
jgi:hypothetical protein